MLIFIGFVAGTILGVAGTFIGLVELTKVSGDKNEKT